MGRRIRTQRQFRYVRNDVLRKLAVNGPDTPISLGVDLGHSTDDTRRATNELLKQRIIVRISRGSDPTYGLTDYGRTLWNAAKRREDDWTY